MDRYGRKIFIVGGVLLIGLSNAGFLLFESYSILMVIVRLIQGIAFAACFNGCSTAVVDLIPPEHRAQGLGLFGVSGSMAVAAGPYLGERVLLLWGFGAYFALLIGFGVIGFLLGMAIKEPAHKFTVENLRGFFPTAIRDRHLPMMVTAAAFGSGFGAMNTFFPLYAKTLGLQAGIFFVCYGLSLLFVRILLGRLADQVRRDRLILACLVGFGTMMLATSFIRAPWHTIVIGVVFGVLQGLSYPAMMAQMVDRSREDNRAVVVGLFTGSFGAGINISLFVWGYIADATTLHTMYLLGGLAMFAYAAARALSGGVKSRR
jgi:MFS family permease